MSIETDKDGRIYLPADLREKYGEKFHIVQYADRIELIPIADDPLQAVRDAAGEAFDGKSIDGLRDEGREEATREAVEDLGE
jgi:bifunctional DNA-binding transcriptional regulator/antitoxin component of YhaV-PrlF toxin-antitoxin module